MHTLLAILALIAVPALFFWGALAIVDRLQKRKRNSPQLDTGPDESQNADIGGAPD